MFRGELVPCFEVPARADFVLQELVRRRMGSVLPPTESSTRRTQPLRQPSDRPLISLHLSWHNQPADRPTAVSALGFEATLTIIHTPRYLEFLAHAWDEWQRSTRPHKFDTLLSKFRSPRSGPPMNSTTYVSFTSVVKIVCSGTFLSL